MEFRVNPSEDLLAEAKRARERANLTQVEFAAALGVSPRTVQNWEAKANGHEPLAKHRRKIIAFLEKLEEEEGVPA